MRYLEKIQNIIRWIPILWKDHDWDYYYLYRIIEFKLQNMYNLFTSKKSHVKHEPNHIHQLKICLLLLNRINNDIVSNNDLAKSVFRPYIDQSDTFMERLIKLDNGDYLMEPMTPEVSRIFKKFINHQEYLQEQDYYLLHKLMAKYSRVWWD